MNTALLRRSRLAFGIGVVCVMFLVETSVADRVTPNPASPVVWAVLGTVVVVALLASAWWRYQAGRTSDPA